MSEYKGSAGSALILAMMVLFIMLIAYALMQPWLYDQSTYKDLRHRGDSLYQIGQYEKALSVYEAAQALKSDDRYLRKQINLCQGNLNIGLNKTFGGRGRDVANDLVALPNGKGYIMVGDTESYGNGDSDIWVLKLDKQGHAEWRRTYGGAAKDEGNALRLMPDGGILVLGNTLSHGLRGDGFLIKLNAKGRQLWQKNYGGDLLDVLLSLDRTTDDNWVLAGFTLSEGEGKADMWMLKVDGKGNEIWNKTYGGEHWDVGMSVAAASNGGFAVAGHTKSFGDASDTNAWIVRFDAEGNPVFEKKWGGDKSDIATAIVADKKGGFMVAGNTLSYGNGLEDVWIMSLNQNGRQRWQKIVGGSKSDFANDITHQNGMLTLAGYTESYGSGNKDAWLMQFNASGSLQWETPIGTSAPEGANALTPVNDGFVISGFVQTDRNGLDFWIFNTDPKGKMRTKLQ